MGEFSKIEIKILDRLTEVIDGKLESIGYDNSEKDRMLYSTCLNDDEKYKFTKKEIKKLQKKIRYSDRLENREIEVVMWDERLTSVAAERSMLEADMSRAKRKKIIDKLAAVYILQGYLDSRR